MYLRKPKPLRRHYKPGDRIMLYDHALKRWYNSTVIGYERKGRGLYELLYVIRDGAEHKEGHVPDDNFRDVGKNQRATTFRNRAAPLNITKRAEDKRRGRKANKA